MIRHGPACELRIVYVRNWAYLSAARTFGRHLPRDTERALWLRFRGRVSRSLSTRERARLEQRIENLRKQHEWGDITDAVYRAGRAETEAQLAGLPTNDKLIMFDRKREVLLSMAENIERATPAQLQALVLELVERVETAHRAVTRVV